MLGAIYRHNGALDLICKATVIVEPLRHVPGLCGHLRDELAIVTHLNSGKVLRMLCNQIANETQFLAAHGGSHIRPRARFEGTISGLNGAVHISVVAFGDQSPTLARVGV